MHWNVQKIIHRNSIFSKFTTAEGDQAELPGDIYIQCYCFQVFNAPSFHRYVFIKLLLYRRWWTRAHTLLIYAKPMALFKFSRTMSLKNVTKWKFFECHIPVLCIPFHIVCGYHTTNIYGLQNLADYSSCLLFGNYLPTLNIFQLNTLIKGKKIKT